MAKLLASLAALAFFALPLAASASTLSDLQAKLQSLLSQVSIVQAEIAALQAGQAMPVPSAGPIPCSFLSQHFSLGETDAATAGGVSALQKALAADPSIYPEGLVTGYFGPATTRAVARLTSRCAPPASGVEATPPATSSPLVSIDQPSLVSPSPTPTITGKARNVPTLVVTVDAGDSISYENDSVPVVNGAWSATTSPLSNGAYKVVAKSPAGNALAAGYLIVSIPSGASSAATSSPPVSPYLNSGSGSAPALLLSTPPTVSIFANGSAHGATVASGGKALITWNAGYVSSCAVSSDNPNALSGAVPAYGGAGSSTGVLVQTTMFTVVCTGADGTIASSSVTVTVMPR
jgi:hypothetical protein